MLSWGSGTGHYWAASYCFLPEHGDVAVVVHVASNDIRVASSEWLKQDFIELIGTLKDSKKHPIISGPVPSLSRGSERFSRLLALHEM